MDPTKRDPEITKLAAGLAGVAEKQFATFLDDLARSVEEGEWSYHEVSWALRQSASHLRNTAAKRVGES